MKTHSLKYINIADILAKQVGHNHSRCGPVEEPDNCTLVKTLKLTVADDGDDDDYDDAKWELCS